jgi:hypothetical protein
MSARSWFTAAVALGVSVCAVGAVSAGAATRGAMTRMAPQRSETTPVPMTHPLPANEKPPPGWIAIEEVSNGCGGGEASTEPGLQNWIGDSATFGDGLLTDPRYEVNFREACNLHDAAYSGAYVWDSIHGKFTDFRGMTQKEADDKLQSDMDRLCEKTIPARWETTRANCKAGIGHWLAVRAIGGLGPYKRRIDLTGKWFNTNPGWPLCDTGGSDWTVTQTGRRVTAEWQHGTDGSKFGHFEGTLITRDHDSIVQGTYTVTAGRNGPKVDSGEMMFVVNPAADSIDFNGKLPGGNVARREQGLNSLSGRLARGQLPKCSPSITTTTQTQPTKPAAVEPTTLTLTVNGKSDTATTARPTNDDPNPLVVHYGTPLNIKVTANTAMPKGWSIQVHHNGDVLSTGSGDYPAVCQVKTGASSCSVTRPPPTAALTGDVDDIVYAQLLAPTYVARNVQIIVNYRK